MIETGSIASGDEFYTQLFTENAAWSMRYPHPDEATRVGKILPWMSLIAQKHNAILTTPPRIIDVGCGRGWLSHILSVYGKVIGIDPVASVIGYARRIFPELDFAVATPDQYVESEEFTAPFDVVVCSEVIEHVPYEQQYAFLSALWRLTRPGGDVIISTPRGELFRAWENTIGSKQPVENWLTEIQLDRLVQEIGFVLVARERCQKTKLRREGYRSLDRRLCAALCFRLGYHSTDSNMYQLLWLTRPVKAFD